jgi:tetratricopeptide (TPR) repeat protein
MQNASPELRRVVPQWRSIGTAFASHELASPGSLAGRNRVTVVTEFAPEFLERLERFRIGPELVSAAELVESAIVLGEEGEAINAARILVSPNSQAVPLLRIQAAQLLSRNNAAADVPEELRSRAVLNAASWRGRIRANVTDSLSWVELARIQLCAGHIEHAKKSMNVALALSPNDRHVLRSAVRLYFQTGEYDRSYAFVRRNPATPSDPWLMAAEIALADYVEKSPYFAKRGLGLVDSETQLPSQISELAGALGTDMLKGGGNRRGRNLIRKSLGAPTANAIAQAEWLSRSLGERLVHETQIVSLPGAWEARGLHAFNGGLFEEALKFIVKWIESEGYSSQAYASAAAVANVLDKFHEAIQFTSAAAKISAISDPLLNAYAFAQASLGNLDAAERSLRRLSDAKGLQHHVAKANLGLIAFRRGDVETAQKEYKEALSGFRKIANREMEAVALIYFAYELRRADQVSDAEMRFNEFVDLGKRTKLPSYIETISKRIVAKMESMAKGASTDVTSSFGSDT